MATSARGNLARTPGIIVLAVLGLLALSCASRDGPTGAPDDTPEAAPAGVEVRTLRFEKGLHLLDEETREYVMGRTRTRTGPAEIPEHARASIEFIIDRPRDGVHQIVGGSVRETLVLGNYGPWPMGQVLLCLRNGRPTVCGSAPAASRIPPATVDVVHLDIAAATGDRIDVLIVPDNQVPGPWGTGHSFLLFAGGRSSPPAGRPAPEVETERAWPWDGCGFARLLRDPPPWHEGVRLPVRVDRGADVFLLIERCPGPPETLTLVPIADASRVIKLEGAVWSGPIQVVSSTIVVRIRGEELATLHEFQVAVLRERFGSGEGRAVWFSNAAGLSP